MLEVIILKGGKLKDVEYFLKLYVVKVNSVCNFRLVDVKDENESFIVENCLLLDR